MVSQQLQNSQYVIQTKLKPNSFNFREITIRLVPPMCPIYFRHSRNHPKQYNYMSVLTKMTRPTVLEPVTSAFGKLGIIQERTYYVLTSAYGQI